MVFGLISAVGTSLFYFVGTEIDSASRTNKSIVEQKISKISESLRVIRTYDIDSDARSWGVEVVNTGLAEIKIVEIHYFAGDHHIRQVGCATMEMVPSDNTRPCTIMTGVLVDMRFGPTLNDNTHETLTIVIVTAAGNTFSLVSY